jgi:hypothetical protein
MMQRSPSPLPICVAQPEPVLLVAHIWLLSKPSILQFYPAWEARRFNSKYRTFNLIIAILQTSDVNLEISFYSSIAF